MKPWTLIKILFNVALFVATGYQGITALIHHADAGWFAGFVFCASGEALFGKHGYLSSKARESGNV